MCAPRRAAAVVRPRGREKSADRRRRILISRLLIIRASVPRWKSPFPAYFKGFPAVSPLIPPYPTFLKYPVSPQLRCANGLSQEKLCAELQRRGCDIGRTTYAKYESGELNVRISVLDELKDIYNCTYDELLRIL